MAGAQRVRWIDVEWEKAKCIGHDEPNWFFEYEHSRTMQVNRNVEEQRQFCSDCPILVDCFNYSLGTDVHGFWGGTTREDRKIIRKANNIEYESLTFEEFSQGRKTPIGRRLAKSS